MGKDTERILVSVPVVRRVRPRIYFGLLVFWVALTLFLTSLPNRDITMPVPYFDKIAHVSFYAVMGFLCALWRREYGAPRAAALAAGLLFAAAVGAVDEIHQHWIPGRSTDIFDWFADAAGGGLGAVLSSALTAFFPSLLTE